MAVELKEMQVFVDELEIGMYVTKLDRPWTDTDFLLQGFLIESQEDIVSLSQQCKFVFIQTKEDLTKDRKSVAEKNNKDAITVLNVRQLIAIKLFGDSQVSNSNVIDNSELDAPVTRLNLKLRGVYAAEEEKLAGVMIEAQNKQDVYRVGAKLPGASGLKLHKIMADRVIMSRAGKFETLLIEDFSGKSALGTKRNTIISSKASNNTRPSPNKNSSDNNI